MNEILSKISEIGIIPVVTIQKAADAVPMAKALRDGGLPCVEITFRTEAAEEAIRLIAKELPDMLVGAGTVLTTDQVDRAVSAGAQFIVSPGLNPDTVRRCLEKGILPIPGVSCASDIEAALALGVDTVKFFPAEICGGLKAVKALAAPYTQVRFIPTGGVNIDNLGKYLAFPKVLACGGSWMIDPKKIEAQGFSSITELARQAVACAAKRGSGEADSVKKTEIGKRAADTTAAPRVITFGEIMLRLAPEGYNRFVQADRLNATFGGGEANVAVSLAQFGFDAAFVTKLPGHEIGQAAVNSLWRYGVDTSRIVRGGNRVGIYYLEKGASQRASKVIYDRAYSSMAEADTSDFDWDAILDGAQWFHFTGITPALGDGPARLCLQACKAAQRKGIPVSCDLNYRKNLWSREKARQVMSELCQYVNVCIANEEDAKDVFGIEAEHTDITGGQLNHEGYKSVAAQLTKQFGFQKVAITLRGSISASDNEWGAMLYEEGAAYFSRNYRVHIVDRVGGGDSFGAGFIYATLTGMEPQETLEFAVAASCLKHTIEGDFNLIRLEEVKLLAGGDVSGRVQR